MQVVGAKSSRRFLVHSALGFSGLAALFSAGVAWAQTAPRSTATPQAAAAAAPAAVEGASVGVIPFKNGAVTWMRQTPLERVAAVNDVLATGGRHFVMHFDRPITSQVRTQANAAGVELLNYLSDNAFFAAVQPNNWNPAEFAKLATLVDVQAVQRDWKLHPDLLAGLVMPWSIVGSTRPAAGQVAGSQEEPAAADETSASTEDGEIPQAPGAQAENQPQQQPVDDSQELIVAVYVLFHPDLPLESDPTAVALQHGGAIRGYLESISGMVLEMPFANINALADEDAVMWIEPPLPLLTPNNDSNRARVQANQLQAQPYGLDGSGVTVLVYDAGTANPNHTDLIGRLQVRDTSGEHFHALHVSGTVGGNGTASSGTFRGMAPGVLIESYGLEQDGPLHKGFLYTDPCDIEEDYGEAINVHGADISNNSIGTNTAPNGYPCDWEGNYGVTDVLIDTIVRGGISNNVPFRIVWSAGNERGSGRCGAMYRTSAPPANAKNHITVGALNSNDDSMTSFSSWGPADDGRLRPDISGPGCEVGNDGGVTSTQGTNSYGSLCGTSMSGPTVAGISALLLQDYRAQFPDLPDFRNSTLKILLAHTAADVEQPGPDCKTGYGSVRAQAAVDFMRSGNFTENAIEQGQVYQAIVIVNPGDPQLKVTLAWDDPPGTPLVAPSLVNDLDLRVFDASNTEFFPYTINPANPSVPAVSTLPDHLNNIEQVVINAPPAGAYRVEVRGFNVPIGPQPFSICASPQLVQCSSRGFVQLDRSKYACDGSIAIRVVDCDLNTDDGSIQTVQVNASSDTESGGESVTLTETAPETATFFGTINLSTTNSAGVLQVSPGDDLLVRYIDADDGQGGMNVAADGTATVDCATPIVSNLQITGVGPHEATVSFTTDEPARFTLRYGLSCASVTTSVPVSGFRTSHTLRVTGLLDDTPHFFVLDLEDEAGNTGTNDNNGNCHTFSTPPIPDPYAELFDQANPNDLDNTGLYFVPDGSIDFYSVCRFPTSALPTDPTGGTVLTLLPDNGSQGVTLTGGATVRIYGQVYSSLQVASNGYVVFGQNGDASGTESFATHYFRARVSALFDDLDPTEGGSVSYKQMTDRLAITWLNVPENTQGGAGNVNTFQIELYFDGRIQMSWLRIDAIDGLAGLSAGGGIPADFLPSSLSAYLPCGPRPPSAADSSITLATSRPKLITLFASDDGAPGPLSYIVMSLPTQELRDTGNGHLITEGELPYTLVGGGNQVTYLATGGFNGLETFQFKVNDGGTPPTGGDSNLATIQLTVEPLLTLPFVDNFPATSFDPGKWAVVTGATIDGVALNPPSPPFAARLNGQPLTTDQIRTYIFDFSGVPSVRLIYDWERGGGAESPDEGDDLFVEYLDAAGNWQLLQQLLGQPPDTTTFTRENLLLPAEALHDGFRLRFRNHSNTSTASDDWFVDDVKLVLGGAPLASSGSVEVGRDHTADITLVAEDSDPLQYRVLSLPAHGTLSDPAGGAITSVPYTLLGGGNVVTYTPAAGYLGSDNFNFLATDGTFDSEVTPIAISVVPLAPLPFFDDFPTTTLNSAKWETPSTVAINGDGLNEPSPPNSANLDANGGGGEELRSRLLDLAGHTQVELSYRWQRGGGGDSPETNDDLVVEYRDAGGVWQQLRRHLGVEADTTTFLMEQIALPPAALHAAARIRFRGTSTSTLVGSDDWFVDDVQILDVASPTAEDGSATIAVNATAILHLQASDPQGDPLDFIITALPALGELSDPAVGPITAVPYTLIGGGNVVRYEANSGAAGADSFRFRASDGPNLSNIATFHVQVGIHEPIYSFALDSNPGWGQQGQWQFGQPLGLGSQNGDPSAGFTGTNVLGYNLSGDYTNNLAVQYLTTTPLDCTGLFAVQLRFQRWLGVERQPNDRATVEASPNGSTWTVVWENPSGVDVADIAWSAQALDVSAQADDQPAAGFRWGMGPTNFGTTFPGWNIDDVEVWAIRASIRGDVNRDCDVDLNDLATLLANFGLPSGAGLEDGDVDGDGDVDLGDLSTVLSVFGSVCP